MPIVNTNTNSIPPRNYVLGKKETTTIGTISPAEGIGLPGRSGTSSPGPERSNVLTDSKDN